LGDDDLAKIINGAAANSETLNAIVLDANLNKAKESGRSILALRSLFEGSMSVCFPAGAAAQKGGRG
jgi:hypothetical protein